MFTSESIPLLLLVYPLQYFSNVSIPPFCKTQLKCQLPSLYFHRLYFYVCVIGKDRNLSYSLVPGLLTPSQSNPHRRCDITSKFKIETKFSHALPAVSSSQTSVCVYYLQKLVYEVSMRSETVFFHF